MQSLDLIVVESFNKASKLERMFPGRFKVMAIMGPICDLLPSQPGEIGIDRHVIQGIYGLNRNPHRTIDGVRSIAAIRAFLEENPRASVYLGTDADLDGESLAAFIMKYAALSQPKRLRFNALRFKEIDHAIQQQTVIDWQAVAACEARRLVDHVITQVATPLAAMHIGHRGGEVERLQTVVQALLVERERSIRRHRQQPTYAVTLEMGDWSASWVIPPSAEQLVNTQDNANYDIDGAPLQFCNDESVAHEVAAQRTLLVLTCADTEEIIAPPCPLNTIGLIFAADQALGWDAGKTLRVARQLFEGDGADQGHITYHRTSSARLGACKAAAIQSSLLMQGLPAGSDADAQAGDSAHCYEGAECISPVDMDVDDVGADDAQRALYALIYARTICSQLLPARVSVRHMVLIDAKGKHRYSATARSVIDPGWLDTTADQADEMRHEVGWPNGGTRLPMLDGGALVNVTRTVVTTGTAPRPARYSVTSLLAKLDCIKAIHPSAIASLVGRLTSLGTVKLNADGTLVATALAERLYDFLYPRFCFAHIRFAIEFESALDAIAEGRADGQSLVRRIWDTLDAEAAVPSTEHKKTPTP